MKRLIVVIGSVVAVFMGLVLAAVLFFPKAKIRDLAVAEGSRALGRPLQVQLVGISFWGGFGAALQQVSIANPPGFGGEPFAAIDRIDIKISLLSLLTGKIEIEKLVIDHPRLRIIRKLTGEVNYHFAADSSAPAQADSTGSGNQILFGRIELHDGSVQYTDDSSAVQMQMEKIDGTTTAALVDSKTRAELTLRIGTTRLFTADTLIFANLSADGTISYDPGSGSLKISRATIAAHPLSVTVQGSLQMHDAAYAGTVTYALTPVSLAPLLKVLPEKMRAQFASYRLDGTLGGGGELTLTHNGASSGVLHHGRLFVANLRAAASGMSGELAADSLLVTAEPGRILCALTHATFDHQPLSLRSTITTLEPAAISAAAAGQIDLALVQPFLPPSHHGMIGGGASFQLDVSGPLRAPSQWQTSGELTLRDVHYADSALPEPITDLDGKLSLTGTTMTIQSLNIRFQSSDLSLTGQAENLLPWMLAKNSGERKRIARPELTFAANSHRFDSDKLFPEATPGARLDSSAILPDSLTADFFPDIGGKGSFAIDTLIYCRMAFTGIRGTAAIQNKIVTCTDVTGKLYAGTVAGETSIDFKNWNAPVYDGKFSCKEIEANDFLSRYTPMKGVVFGKADLSGTFGATGWEPADFLKSLTLDGQSLIHAAHLVTSGPIKEGITALAQKVGTSFSGEQALRELTAKISVRNGRVGCDPIAVPLGEFASLTFGGSYGFDNTTQGTGTLTLSEAASQKLMASGGIAGSLLGGKSGQIALPISVGGTITKPTLTIDYKGAIAAAANNARQEAEHAAGEAATNAAEKGLGEVTKGLDSTLKKTAGGLLKGLLKKP